MNNSPFDKAVVDKAQKHCESCRWMRKRVRDDVKVEGGHDLDTHWCHKNDFPTTPLALRCGGDDWESIPSAQERRSDLDAMGEALDKFLARHGIMFATEFLISELVKIHRKGTLKRADYAGDDFRVAVSILKRPVKNQ